MPLVTGGLALGFQRPIVGVILIIVLILVLMDRL
jgi:hypothetical protein